MNLLTAVLALVGGFVLLVVGGEALVRAAISLAVRTRISPAIISLTIVAAGTSAPELVASLAAALKGIPDVAVGNVIGSNVFNIWAILGISFLLMPPRKSSQGLGFETLVVILATALTAFFAFDLHFHRWEGITFTAIFVAVIYISVQRARKTGFVPDEDEPMEALKSPLQDTFYLLLGLGCLVGGAQLALEGGVFLGKWIGLSEKVIGLTIISVGTGLPELATSAVAAYRGRSDIAIGNVLGSNIMNTLAVLGLTSAIQPLSINPEVMKIDIWILGFATLLIIPITKNMNWALSRIFGLVFLACYLVFVAGSVIGWS